MAISFKYVVSRNKEVLEFFGYTFIKELTVSDGTVYFFFKDDGDISELREFDPAMLREIDYREFESIWSE